MSKAKSVLFLAFLFCLSSVKSSLLLPEFELPWDRIDACKNSCDKTYEGKSPNHVSSCSRGCRFYSMAEMIAKTTELDMTIVMKACSSSCQDSYLVDTPERSACLSGCNTMNKLRKPVPEDITISSTFSFSFFFDDGNGLKSIQQSDGDTFIPGEAEVSVGEPDMASLEKDNELETVDVLTDPALMGQSGIGILSEIKLPVVKVKTLPVELHGDINVACLDAKVTSEPQGCWWLPAIVLDAFRYLPPCILFFSVMLLTFIICCLCFGFCRVRIRLQQRQQQITDDDKSALLVDDAFSCCPESDCPKYSLFVPECGALVKQPPPKYDDVIVIDAELAKLAEASACKPTETI